MCRQWFSELEPLGISNGAMRVRVGSPVQEGYLQRQCAAQFNEALQAATGRLIPVLFVRNGEHAAATSTRTHPALGTICDDVVISPDHSFENFVVGPDNRLAHAAALAVANAPGQAYNPLFIHGGVGLGKTHLLQAVCQQVLNESPDVTILYVSCERFTSLFIDSVQNGQCGAFRHRFRDLDVLVIDDIHFLANRDRTQEEFFHTFNTLHQARKQIILSSDAKPDEIPDLEERLVSRFNWGLVAEITAPCYETRLAIVAKKTKMRGLHLDDEIIEYIAATVDRNIRELEGAITRIQGHAMLGDGTIDLALAQRALGVTQRDAPRALTIPTIADAVITHYDVKLTDLQSKRRQRSITLPRQVCMYLARKHTRHSLVEIGGYFGGRDHTTVMHAVQAMEDRQRLYEQIRRDVSAIEAALAIHTRPEQRQAHAPSLDDSAEHDTQHQR